MPGQSTCSKCGEAKSVEGFAVDRSRASVRKSWCKACDNAQSADYYKRRGQERKHAAYHAQPKPQRYCECGAPVKARHRMCDDCLLSALRARRRAREVALSEARRMRRLPVATERRVVTVIQVSGRTRLPGQAFVAGICGNCHSHFVSTTAYATRFCSDHCYRRHHKRVYKRQRRARLMGVTSTPVDPTIVYRRDDWMCRLCIEPIDPTLDPNDDLAASIDHILPLSLGGSHTYENVQAAHRICNVRKGANVTQFSA